MFDNRLSKGVNQLNKFIVDIIFEGRSNMFAKLLTLLLDSPYSQCASSLIRLSLKYMINWFLARLFVPCEFSITSKKYTPYIYTDTLFINQALIAPVELTVPRLMNRKSTLDVTYPR